MRTLFTLGAVLISCAPVLVPLQLRADITYQHIEHFTTTQYRDPVHTTAWWDTLAGQIKLYPLALALTGAVDTPGSAYDVAIAAAHAYVADNMSGLQIVDVSLPGDPVWVGSVDTPGSARAVALLGQIAFVADGQAGLQIVDVSDPVSPVVIGTAPTEAFAQDVAVAGHLACLAVSGAGLQIFDITNPAQPLPLGTCDTEDWAQSLAITGSWACVADGNGGLQVVDISDPSHCSLAGSLTTAGYARGVAITGNYVLMACGNAGLQVISLNNPAQPSLLGQLLLPGEARAIAVSESYALVASGASGLFVIDINHPTSPRLLGGYDSSGGGYGIAAQNLHAYLADGAEGLQVVTLDPAGFDTTANRAQSLTIDASADPIVRARLQTIQTDSIGWELSANGGLNWEPVTPGDSWHEFAATGHNLRWRSAHLYLGADLNPQCSRLILQWQKQHSFPEIRSILDIPGDDGGQVRIIWSSSRHDSLGSPTPITEYVVFRRRDNDAAKTAPQGTATPCATPADGAVPGHLKAALAYPPGSWDYILSLPADCEAEYAAVVPTLVDATPQDGIRWSVFFVRARTGTPGMYFDSPPDSGFSMDNFWPTVPEGFAVSYSATGGNQLRWEPSPDEDFASFLVYRAADPEFAPLPEYLVHTTTGTAWLDEVIPGWGYYYLLSATDLDGNQSIAIAPQEVVHAADRPQLDLAWLGQNRPNPCNSATVIPFTLPADGPVSLRIFDLSGRLVRNLVQGWQPAGAYAILWDGTDRMRQPVASGIYCAVLQTAHGLARRTLTLIK
jgi:hypothetical protein